MTKQTATMWIVQTGWEADCRVLGVYTSREDAEAVATAVGLLPDDCILECPVDAFLAEVRAGLKPFRVRMDASGTGALVAGSTGTGALVDLATASQLDDTPMILQRPREDQGRWLVVGTVWAKDEIGAIRLMDDVCAAARGAGLL